MHTIPLFPAGGSEVTILARVLANADSQLPRNLARYILDRGFSGQDKARMHDLAVSNQADALSPAETEELFAYVKAGSLLSILKTKARKVVGSRLGVRPAGNYPPAQDS